MIFYKDDEGNIFKYKKYCIEENFTKVTSYNYKDKKEFLYCQDHRLNKCWSHIALFSGCIW